MPEWETVYIDGKSVTWFCSSENMSESLFIAVWSYKVSHLVNSELSLALWTKAQNLDEYGTHSQIPQGPFSEAELPVQPSPG